MSWILWNIRGVHRQESIDHLKILLRQHKTSFLVLLEPKACHNEISRFTFNLGFPCCYHGGATNAHIWIFWQANIQVEPLHVTSQEITIKMTSQGQPHINVSPVYANCLKHIRRKLWDHLTWVGWNTALPWLITGDFNIIVDISEKWGAETRMYWPFKSSRTSSGRTV